jgi:signal transduction histidine kinase
MTPATGWYRRAYRLHYPAVPGHAQRTERVLAVGRAWLATWSVLALALDPLADDFSTRIAQGLLVGYAVVSVLLLLLLRTPSELDPGTPLLIHAVDVLWATAATAWTGGLTSPFFILFVFALLSAAYRWGSRETMVTAVAGVALLASQGLLAVRLGPAEPAAWRPLASRTILIRSGSLVVMAYLLGYLADEEKRSQAESAILSRIMARLQEETGLRATLEALLGEVLRLFGARQAMLALNDADDGRAYLWEAVREGGADAVQFRRQELAAGGRARYLFEAGGNAWRGQRRVGPGETGFTVLALDDRGARVAASTLPADSAAELAGSCVIAAGVAFGNQWTGRLFLIDPGDLLPREPEMRLLQTLLRRAAPAVYGAHLASRLQARAGAAERARVARELHDGVIQSLIGLEMQVDVLRQQALARSPDKAGALTHIQALLRHEIVTVRELMDQMRAVDVGATELVDRLAGMVDKFGRETGISARFVSEVEEVSLSPRLCGEITRIVQEALINVRRHSRALNVVVRFGRQDGRWALAIDDDGAGFPFSGRLDLAGLDAEHKGPLVIKERVRSAGGQLTIESHPGRGARLEILISPEGHG